MLLVIALILEKSSGAVVSIVKTPGHIDVKVWAAVCTMALVFGLLLATTVGLLVLHVRFDAPYGYWYVVLDNLFLTVPLYLAVRFIAASTGFDQTPASPSGLNQGLFRTGVLLIAASFIYLFVRDLRVLPKIRDHISVPPLVAVSTLHLLGALLFLSAAVAPSLIVYVAGIGAIGLAFFFTGMAAIPFIESRYAARRPAAGPDQPAAGSLG
ncbi:hypothetical protein [Jidongwangia harbinensis]|uniref:hypothetical protein n=1 Tax=Jidongwangia harbinensis TaxID=2878561 RepID=UPI001CDA12C4|nr:hypothetical protein [Jidongwangia harbinensis]MCA2211293.1 hypothetical protein [Jidongwangia harbinensis]